MKRLTTLLTKEDFKLRDANIRNGLIKLLGVKKTIGNLDMDIHFLASCLANSFLKNRHGVSIGMIKAVGSSGLDIELEQVAAEIKTTSPYLENDFGAKQKETIKKDLERLENEDKKYKYFFVIDEKAETILKQKYSKHYPTVRIINLLKEDIEE